MANEKTMIPQFSEKTRYKRKYHSGMKIRVINTVICWIAEEQHKFLCKDMKVDDLYPCRDGTRESIPLHFSKRLSDFYHVYIYPDVVRELWPVITSVLRYVYYDDVIWSMSEDEKNSGIVIKEKKNWFQLIGEEYMFLKYNGYNATRIPFTCINKSNL